MPKKLKTITAYLHGNKETFWPIGEDELGLKGEEARLFAHALYEIEFELEVYDDGTYKILKVKDGKQELVPVVKTKGRK